MLITNAVQCSMIFKYHNTKRAGSYLDLALRLEGTEAETSSEVEAVPAGAEAASTPMWSAESAGR